MPVAYRIIRSWRPAILDNKQTYFCSATTDAVWKDRGFLLEQYLRNDNPRFVRHPIRYEYPCRNEVIYPSRDKVDSYYNNILNITNVYEYIEVETDKSVSTIIPSAIELTYRPVVIVEAEEKKEAFLIRELLRDEGYNCFYDEENGKHVVGVFQ